jgi:hypothetical protein
MRFLVFVCLKKLYTMTPFFELGLELWIPGFDLFFLKEDRWRASQLRRKLTKARLRPQGQKMPPPEQVGSDVGFRPESKMLPRYYIDIWLCYELLCGILAVLHLSLVLVAYHQP